jgi:hypothetical protein
MSGGNVWVFYECKFPTIEETNKKNKKNVYIYIFKKIQYRRVVKRVTHPTIIYTVTQAI